MCGNKWPNLDTDGKYEVKHIFNNKTDSLCKLNDTAQSKHEA